MKRNENNQISGETNEQNPFLHSKVSFFDWPNLDLKFNAVCGDV